MIWIATSPLWLAGAYLVFVAICAALGIGIGNYKLADGSALRAGRVCGISLFAGWAILILAAWLCGL